MPTKLLNTIMVLAVGALTGWALTWCFAQEPAAPVPTDAAVVAEPAAAESPLVTLDWLVGHWVGETANGKIEFSCHFAKNKAFLIRSFRVLHETEVKMTGMQVVAWDPAQEMIRSWTFDSDGGFGEDTWTQAEDRYTMRTKYTLADGGMGSAINVMKYVDNDSFVWKSTSREIDGELQPDTAEIVISRVAASESQPTTANSAEGNK